jgi:tRNA A-37 threonylcarbamoyl transferase component Bud32/predicted esterase
MADQIDRLKASLADRYTIEREIGAGGMATVYLAHDLKHDRQVAVKVLRPELASVLGAERFLNEIKVTANLQHPHVLALHDSGEAEGFLYYVMPYVEGESLRQRIAREGQLPLYDVARILGQVVDALAEAHAKGIIHRDIKPDNVLLSGRHAVVSDFGVAKAVSEATGLQKLTTAGIALGTPHYMAPEQASADPNVDRRADIYAAGVMGYEMLAGRTPFVSDSAHGVLAAHMTQTPEPVTQHREGVPEQLGAAIMRCLAKDPQDRWQTANDLLNEIEQTVTPTGAMTPARGLPPTRGAKGTLGWIVAAAAVLVVVFVWLSRGFGLSDRSDWALQVAIPEIQRLTEDGQWEDAFVLATEARTVIGDEPLLADLWQQFSKEFAFRTEPAGAEISWRRYGDSSGNWQHIGTTPLEGVALPFGYPSVKYELEGYQPVEQSLFARWLSDLPVIRLDSVGVLPAGAVRVPSGEFVINAPGLEGLDAVELGDYLIDRYEVTNRDYKEFVDAGGYENREYWEHPFERDGRVLSWDEAMSQFVDRTGRRGPSTWEVGDYPGDEGDHPAAGVSWYEAAAYAQFAGRDLPTIYHWNKAADVWGMNWVVPRSNYDDEGTAPVGAHGAPSGWNVHDMAGNVREWCYNISGNERFILGGGWNDAPYMFNDAYAQSPWDRSPTNGFRLVTYLEGEANLEVASRPIERAFRDFLADEPVSDDIFEVYLRMFDYDSTPLNAVIEVADTTSSWIRQRITFDAAYGGQRMVAYLHLPVNAEPPYQTVAFFPGSNSIFTRSINQDMSRSMWDFIVKSGRAFLYPVYDGTWERGGRLTTDQPSESNSYRDYVIRWAQDLGRSLDYAETREDLDTERLAYHGYSWGGRMGGLMLAVEPRFDAAVLYVAGLKFQRALPEADPFNYVSRVRSPVLMLNGRWDNFFPLETSQKPMFQLLGTPAADKRHVVYDGGHFVPRPQLISETLDWLDKYLGPVRR